jgi:EmrB/QacA subfamily drug resistance transporter
MTKKQSTLVMIGLLLGVLLEALDSTIVGTALPRVVADLGGFSQLSWVFSAYLLTSTVSTPLYGKLSDMYGRMPFYLGGMILFMLGSVAAALAQDMTQLIVCRGVQGLGAGAMMPIAIALAQTVFPPAERGKIQGAISGAFGLAAVFGPTLGGFITDHLSWRWVFYVNVPVGIMAAVLLFANVPASGRRTVTQPGKGSADYLGALTLTVFATALMLGFIWAGDAAMGWTAAPTLGAFSVALAGLMGFLVAERRAADPIVPLPTFRNRTFTVSVLTSLLTGGAMLATLSYLPLFVQGVLGASATDSGAVTTPMMIALVIGTTTAGRLVGRRVQHYKWMALFAGAAMVAGTALMTTLDAGSGQWPVILYMIIFGLGLGISFPLYTIAVAASMEPRYLGVSIALLTFFRNLGGAMSLALLGAMLTAQLNREVPAQLQAHVPAAVLTRLPLETLAEMGPRALTNADAIAGLRRMFATFDPSGRLAALVLEALRIALANAVHTMFLGGLVIAVLALIASLGLKNERLNLAQLRRAMPGAEAVPRPESPSVAL